MEQAGIRTPDVFGRTFELDEATLDILATRLEARGRHPLFRQAVDDYAAELALNGEEAILDLGTGTGSAARRIAARSTTTRPIVAIDISAHLVAKGRSLAAAEGLGERIDFRVGDAHAPTLQPGSFDVVVMHTLLTHVADPARCSAQRDAC